MKKLFKTFAVLAVSSTLAFANVNPTSFKVGMYNVHNTHTLKVFVNKESSDGSHPVSAPNRVRILQMAE